MEQDPVFQVIQEMENFRMKIHNDVHEFSVCRKETMELERLSETNQALIKLGFPSLVDEDEMNEMQATARGRQKKMRSQLSQRSDQYRRLGLGEYIDAGIRAMDIEWAIQQRSFVLEYNADFKYSPWESLLERLAENLKLFEERQKLFPLWGLLEYKRLASGSKGFENASWMDIPSEMLTYLLFMQLMTNATNVKKRTRTICHKYTFHCQYLDDELKNMITFMAERSGDPYASALFNLPALLCEDDASLCEYVISLLQWNSEVPYSFYRAVAVRMYRACMRRGHPELTEEWMNIRWNKTVPHDQLCSLLDKILKPGSRESLPPPQTRVKLNGLHTGVSSSYRLPVPKTETSPPPRKLWWIERLKTRPTTDVDQNLKSEFRGAKRESWNSQATTKHPSESSSDKWWDKHSAEELSILFRDQNIEANRAASVFYRDHSIVSSNNMCRELPLWSIHSSTTESLIKLVNSSSDQERRTNLQVGRSYHCRIYSYDALEDEWIGNDTFCKFNGLLHVSLEGGSRVPLSGDEGDIILAEKQMLFKMYRDMGDHRIDKYLADVRAQSVAAHYVNRFRKLTSDKFGCLTMLTVELLLVYDTSERNAIIDFATCEISVDSSNVLIAGGYAKFTNNWSWKNRDIELDILEAFSHFTYHDSDGALMVTDLQGVAALRGLAVGGGIQGIQYVLTDPVIHCQPRDTQTFGRNNYGTDGMDEFFATIHRKCNHICDFLNLKRPNGEA